MSSVVVAILAFAVAATALYLVLAVVLTRRARLKDDELEWIQVPLPTAGHFAALTHHPPRERRFATPVILCHGLAANRFNLDLWDDGEGSDRVSLARTLARAGFDVWLLELRGHGRGLVPRGADWTVDDEIREDVPRAIAVVLERSGADRVLWVGHSKGSMIQYFFQASGHPLAEKVAGLVALGSPGTLAPQQKLLRRLVGPGRWLLRLFGGLPLGRLAFLIVPVIRPIRWAGWRFDTTLADNDPRALARVLASLPADIPRGVAGQFLQWLAHEEGALLDAKGGRYDAGFSKLSMPMLLIAGRADLLAPPESMTYLRDRVSSKDVTSIVLGKKEGFSRDYGHGDLIVGRSAPTEVFPLIVAWLEARAAALEVGTPSPPSVVAVTS